MAEPVRAEARRYRCRCVLVSLFEAVEDDPSGRCHAEVTADAPFCDTCVDRHTQHVGVLIGLVEVSVVPLGEP